MIYLTLKGSLFSYFGAYVHHIWIQYVDSPGHGFGKRSVLCPKRIGRSVQGLVTVV